MEQLVIVGASGHGKVVLDLIRAHGGYEVVGFLDLDRDVGSHFCGEEILGRQQEYGELARRHDLDGALVAIGDNHKRQRVVEELHESGASPEFPAVVHPFAHVAPGVELGPGTVVMAGAVVNPGSTVGRHCVVNTRASVDHDCVLGDFVSVSPGATLGGDVEVRDHAFISLGADLIHGVTVGEHTVVGAGAVVIHDLPARCIAYGVPARVQGKREPDDPYL